MARSRNIKPSFFTNDELAEVAPLGRLLFIALWTMADREGRLEDRPRRIKAEALPYDDADVNALLHELDCRGFIRRYEVDGQRFIQVLAFTKHQNPHIKEAPSTIPAPDEHGASPVQDTAQTGASPADSLLLIPDSSRGKTARGSRMPDDWAPSPEETRFALETQATWDEAYVAAVAEKFADYWRSQPGMKGRKTDWSATWRNWVRNEKPRPKLAAVPSHEPWAGAI